MIKFMVMFGFVLFTNACNLDKSQKKEVVIYTFSNPSLGPIDGTQKVKLIMKDGSIIYAIDLSNNRQINLKEIKGISAFKKALVHQNGGLIVDYSSDNIPMKIIKKDLVGQVGGAFTIKVTRK